MCRFSLLGGCALATGIGATVSALPDKADDEVQHLIVITPNAGVSTAEAYAAAEFACLDNNEYRTLFFLVRITRQIHDIRNRGLCRWKNHLPDDLKNDFESVIFDIEPEIRRTKEALLQAGALGALLAGSGSSVFGIFADREDQQRALNEIKLEAGWRIFPCVTVSRNEYLRAVGSWDIPFLRSFNFGSDIGA